MRPSASERIGRLVASAGSLLLAASLLAAPAPAAAAADLVADLGVAGKGGDLVAGHGKVFVAADDRIVVTDLDGEAVTTIGGLSGVTALSAPDGARKVYATLSGTHEVIEIDTATVAVTRRIDLSAYPCPSTMAQAHNRLWIGYGCGGAGEGGVVAVDMRATPILVKVGPATTRPPLVAVAGAFLAVSEPGVSPANVRLYDVNRDPGNPLGEIIGDADGLPPLEDLALAYQGSAVLPVPSGAHRFDAWDTTTFDRAHAYDEKGPAGHDLAATVAASENGYYVVGGWNSAAGDAAELVVYDATTREVIYTAGQQGKALVAGSIGFYGIYTFAVLKEPGTGRMHLWRLPSAPYHSSRLTLTAPAEANALKPLTISGRLTLSTGATPGVQTLHLYSWLPDGTDRPFREVTTAADGTYEFTDTPPGLGAFRYRLSWPGNSWYYGAYATATVTVARYEPALIVTGPATGAVGELLEFRGTFAAEGVVYPRTTVTVSRRAVAPDGTVTTKSEKLAPATDGTFAFTDTPATAGEHTYTVTLVGSSTVKGTSTNHVVTVVEPAG
ncbi:hypothetical protein AB0L44_19300 [Nonomuraea wenchangensis]|uniref:hypothetical protein n=1 Tax=Nonomuraea wenchangensis TaxID=568860 RepID=UPI00343ACCF4